MKDLMLGMARAIRAELGAGRLVGQARRVLGDSPGGDAQFDIDETAERVAWDYLQANATEPIAVYTEDRGLRTTGPDPRHVLIVDPIDGTRPASADLELANVSIAAAPMSDDPVLGSVDHALLLELKTGNWMYGGADQAGITGEGYAGVLPNLSRNEELATMFWSIEFNGHPMSLMTAAYAHLVDVSANTGGVFVFNSASFSISRIITGQLDAYVDIGNRLLHDHPETEAAFRKAGRGSILHLFPYDIAASVFLAERAGVTITDAYGRSLAGTRLFDLSPENQQSCIAASTPTLHKRILESVVWDLNGTAHTAKEGVL
ncbi:myo-inositol-1(or 4)-monophosphatase [Sinosporangium album]|uniref:Myo-inositol-1(Or 4)-monophosphatase n=1 Tax=Sinosporangium album TaxID=504805 RepID=A0A1G7YQK5_9ACTN|nr:inositol monophosphatase family protein [Sinosporangium album]SDG98842.1 myo-inositol-1(or 4)-monophosphatase [Sinosporangium album]